MNSLTDAINNSFFWWCIIFSYFGGVAMTAFTMKLLWNRAFKDYTNTVVENYRKALEVRTKQIRDELNNQNGKVA